MSWSGKVLDARYKSKERITPTEPLPFVSRKALKRVKHPQPVPDKCRYCSGAVVLENNSKVYNGRSYGEWPFVYMCSNCDSYVGLHPFTDIPLGTLADRKTREARKKAKSIFYGKARSLLGKNRSSWYAYLSQKMGISEEKCHFGLFDSEQLDQVIKICLSDM